MAGASHRRRLATARARRSDSQDATGLLLRFEVTHVPVAFDGVAGMAEQLEIPDGVLASTRPRRDLIDGQDVKGQLKLAADAFPLLAPIQKVFVGLRIDRAQEGQVISARRLLENKWAPRPPLRLVIAAHGNLEFTPRPVPQNIGGLRQNINPDPITPQFLSGDAGCGAAAERIQQQIAGVGGDLDYSLKQRQWLLCSPAGVFGIPR